MKVECPICKMFTEEPVYMYGPKGRISLCRQCAAQLKRDGQKLRYNKVKTERKSYINMSKISDFKGTPPDVTKTLPEQLKALQTKMTSLYHEVSGAGSDKQKHTLLHKMYLAARRAYLDFVSKHKAELERLGVKISTSHINPIVIAKYSPKAQEVISDKMRKMQHEDKPQDQKAAIALNEAREKGLKVPEKRG